MIYQRFSLIYGLTFSEAVYYGFIIFDFRKKYIRGPSCLELNQNIGTIIELNSVQGVKSLGGHFACLCRGF